MKINEIAKPSDQYLYESLDSNNQTGFLTEDLVRVVKTEQAAQWSPPMTADELLAEMDSWETQ
jgi:hypothetical protein